MDEREHQEQYNQLVGFAITGIEAETFLDSNIGKYMTDMVEGKREAAITDFRKLEDPGDEQAIKKMLLDLKVCDLFDDLIKCAIEGGKAAQMELERRTAID